MLIKISRQLRLLLPLALLGPRLIPGTGLPRALTRRRSSALPMSFR